MQDFTNHAGQRALERYGERLTIDEQFAMLRRIKKGAGIPLKAKGKDKYPRYLVSWDRMRTLIPIVVRPDHRYVVTVLPNDCKEVRRFWERAFG